jgi:inorganic pyrophosphatase/exopolyphosphatase
MKNNKSDSKYRDIIVRLVDIDGIVDHHRLSFAVTIKESLQISEHKPY